MSRGRLQRCAVAGCAVALALITQPARARQPSPEPEAGKAEAAEAEDQDVDEVAGSEYDWHVGINGRTDFGTHPLRIDGGVRLRQIDLILVLDPMFWTDGQVDTDLYLDGQLGSGWSIFGGWRATSVGLAGGRQWQLKSMLGVAARFPALLSGHLRGQAGLELTLLWVKQGGGLPTSAISFASGRDLSDHVNFGLFARLEYAAPF